MTEEAIKIIQRKVEFVSITGEISNDAKLDKPYGISKTHSGGWDDAPFSKITGKHKPLTDCHAEFDANRQSAINNMIQQFSSVVHDDLTFTLPKKLDDLLPGVQVSTTPIEDGD